MGNWPGVRCLSSNESEYTNDDGVISIPHGLPETGVPLEATNYYDIIKTGPDVNAAMRSAGIPVGSTLPPGPVDLSKYPAAVRSKIVQTRHDLGIGLETPVETPAKRTRKSAKSSPVEVYAERSESHTVVWSIPDIGDIITNYSKVFVGDGCIVLGRSTEDKTSFIPLDYRTSAKKYNMSYDGRSYIVIYTGLTYKDHGGVMFILISQAVA